MNLLGRVRIPSVTQLYFCVMIRGGRYRFSVVAQNDDAVGSNPTPRTTAEKQAQILQRKGQRALERTYAEYGVFDRSMLRLMQLRRRSFDALTGSSK